MSHVFLEDLEFQIIKLNMLDKAVLIETCLGVTFEFGDIFVKPDGLSQIEMTTYFLQSAEYFVRAGVRAVVFRHGVLQHMIVPKNFGPDTQNMSSLI